MTTTIGLTDGIIKLDTRGRMRTTRERREALLAEFDRSGMSGQKFSAWAGIKYPTWAPVSSLISTTNIPSCLITADKVAKALSAAGYSTNAITILIDSNANADDPNYSY